MPSLNRDRCPLLMSLLLCGSLLAGCAKQEEESPAQPAPSNTSHPAIPGQLIPENSPAPKASSQPAEPSTRQIPLLDLSYIRPGTGEGYVIGNRLETRARQPVVTFIATHVNSGIPA